MNITIIAALADNGIIGAAGKIPWHLSDDLKRFKRLTLGHPVIMGRKTYDSLGKPLPGRRNLVLTRGVAITGIECFASLEAGLATCRDEIVFIIGGAEIYRQALPLANTLLLTHVHQSVEGDTKFPEFDPRSWQEVRREEHPGHAFVEYRRRAGGCPPATHSGV